MFLVVHIGAGRHSPQLDRKYKKLLKSALENDFLGASRVIEESPLTNTGYGSSLDINGNATSDCTWVAVENGKVKSLSLHNVKHRNPISVCSEIHEKLQSMYAKDTALGKLGLLKPAMLNYDGIQKEWNLPVHDLVLPRAKSVFEKYKSAVEGVEEEIEVQDTIGLIAVGSSTIIASSSGGNILRLPGRISCAGVFGSGVAFHRHGDIEVSCMCSGNGDDILRTCLGNHVAEKLAEAGSDIDLGQYMVEVVQQRCSLFELEGVNHELEGICYFGIIALVKGASSSLVYCHSTESFYFGFRRGDTTEIVLSRGTLGKFVYGEFMLGTLR